MITLSLRIFCAILISLSCFLGISLATEEIPGFPYGVKVITLDNASANSEYISTLNQGLVYFEEKKYVQAQECFRDAIELCPDNSQAYINLAALHLETGEAVEAQNLLKDAVRLIGYYDPGKKIVLYSLGLTYFKNGDYKNSEEYFTAALKLDPGFVPAKNALARIDQEIKDGSEDIALLPEELTPEVSMEGLLQEASEAFKRNEVSKAIDLFNQLIAAHPGYAQAYYRLGVIYASEKDYSSAVSCFTRAVELDPSLINAYTNLGSAYGQLKQYDLALAALLQAEWLDKENPKIKYNIGLVYLSVGQGEKANDYFVKAKELCFSQNNTSLIPEIEKLLAN